MPKFSHREAIKITRRDHAVKGGYSDEHGYADLYIDLGALARRLGAKAAANKSLKTKCFNGIVVVEYVKRENDTNA